MHTCVPKRYFSRVTKNPLLQPQKFFSAAATSRATPPGWGGLVGAPQNDPWGVFGGLHLELLVGLKISGGSRWGDYDTFGGIFNTHLPQSQSKYRKYAPDFIFMMYIVLFLD